MHNLFDELNGLYSDDENNELNGLFKKLKKAVKSGVKSVIKVKSKIAKKTLPSEIRRVGRKLDKAGVTKIAAAAALMVVGGPAIMAGLKGGIGIAAKSVGFVKSAVGATKLASIASTVKTGAGIVSTATGLMSQKQAANAKIQMENNAAEEAIRNAQVGSNLAAAIGKSPEFAQAVAQFRAQGYSDEQILRHWVESKSYYLAAVPVVAKTVYPQVQAQVQNAGYAGQDAADIALVESDRIAQEAVKDVQSKSSSMPLILIAGIAATIFLK